MKKFFKLFGIIALVAIIGFSMAACDDGGGGDGGSNLAGTTWNYTQVGGTFTLTFTATTVRLEYPGGTVNGTYTLNGSSGSIIWNDGGSESFVVNGNTLTIIGNDTSLIFVKGGTTTYSLDGVWDQVGGTAVVTISGSTGTINTIDSWYYTIPVHLDAITKGYMYEGMTWWRNLSKTGNLTWSGQFVTTTYNTSNPNVATGTGWFNGKWTLSSDGQTLIVGDTNGSTGSTWKRRTTYTLDGVWEHDGFQITVSGDTGVFRAFGGLGSDGGVWADAINKGYVSIGSPAWRNLTPTSTRQWSGLEVIVQFYSSNPNVAIGTKWEDRSFSISADGQTLKVGSSTYIRKQ